MDPSKDINNLDLESYKELFNDVQYLGEEKKNGENKLWLISPVKNMKNMTEQLKNTQRHTRDYTTRRQSAYE